MRNLNIQAIDCNLKFDKFRWICGNLLKLLEIEWTDRNHILTNHPAKNIQLQIVPIHSQFARRLSLYWAH